MKDKNPLSPHIQIYNWHISSLISISHRIIGIINIIIVTLICFWVALLILGSSNYQLVQNFLKPILVNFLLSVQFGLFLFKLYVKLDTYFGI